jgi:hypothetical protein
MSGELFQGAWSHLWACITTKYVRVEKQLLGALYVEDNCLESSAIKELKKIFDASQLDLVLPFSPKELDEQHVQNKLHCVCILTTYTLRWKRTQTR